MKPHPRTARTTEIPPVWAPSTLAEARRTLAEAAARFSDTPRMDAERLLAAWLQRPRAWVLAHPEAPFPPRLVPRWRAARARLRLGEPLAYLLREWPCYDRTFTLSPAVLIPRPETEALIVRALELLRYRPQPRVVDVGTGSGCIAVVLAAHYPEARVTGVDRSRAALTIARANAQRHRTRVQWVQTDLLAGVPGPWDLIVANLPYIPTAELAELRVARQEPWLALDGGVDGLIPLRRLLAQARRALAPGGHLLAEVGAAQAQQARSLAKAFFPQATISLHPDGAGRPRVLEIALPSDV
ncbi:MAG: peptide chain release factor N(5)-glutamine methyltransferase [Chloroflexi bacterium]|nr:peptide chain release factor N(5)-glutamine methyltransferase [Chloroflexota bacterium]